MLQALQDQLAQLAVDPHDPFAAEIRKRVGARHAPHYVKPLRDLILVMPQLIAQIRTWSSEPNIPSQVKRLHGFLLTYLYHPFDFIPDANAGLFGYLDDAYLVAYVYERTRSHLNHTEQRSLSKLHGAAAQLPEWLEHTRALLPLVTHQIDYMIDEIIEGRTAIFDRVVGRGERT